MSPGTKAGGKKKGHGVGRGMVVSPLFMYVSETVGVNDFAWMLNLHTDEQGSRVQAAKSSLSSREWESFGQPQSNKYSTPTLYQALCCPLEFKGKNDPAP